ncbi:MAG: hypothetical protein WKF84_05360 [Pyrinomonadaceae bacterium]
MRSDRLTLQREAKSMEGEGHVESALYQARVGTPKEHQPWYPSSPVQTA